MKKSFYLPNGDREKVAWYKNFKTIFASIAASLGFTPEEVTAIINDYIALEYIIGVLDIFKGEMQERTRYKDLLFDGDATQNLGSFPTIPDLPVAPTAVSAGVFKRVAKTVQRIKTHPNYNEAMGKNLGIIGSEKTIDLDTIKPSVSVKSITSESISLDFVKGSMESVAIFAGTPYHIPAEAGSTPEVDTEAELDWVEIARVNHSPFIDTRYNSTNKPETRYYKMRYVKKDALVGQESDIIRVISTKLKPGADLANKVK